MGLFDRRRTRSSAKRLVALWRALEKSATSTAQPGASLNIFGQFWSDAAVEELVSEYRSIIASETDRDARRAATYSLASLLQSALRLGESRQVCEEALASKPDDVGLLRVLAEVSAREGNLSQALELAERIENTPHGTSFRVNLDDLARLAATSERE